jgi:CheY-like chemotaxis protein
MKALIVDDSTMVRKILKNQLKQLGHTDIVEATNGREALVALCDEKPDMVFLDIHMPGMDGRSFMGEMRSHSDVAATPVVVISADSDPKQNEAMLDLGVRCYVTKPFRTEMVKLAIDLAMKSKAPEQSPCE